MTMRLGVIGNPISHSLSPEIHNAWLSDAGLDARYDPIQVLEGELTEAMKSLADHGLFGLNVTLPHKHAALALATKTSKTAQAIGAANTLTHLPGGGWSADNTDAAGFANALSHAGLTNVRNKRVLVLGAGGAARAVVYALHEAGADIVIVNRTLQRAAQLSKDITQSKALYVPVEHHADYTQSADFIVNTTSRGYSGDFLSLPKGGGRLFLDISYGRSTDAQLAHAGELGWQIEDGLAMLVYQAAESFELWFNRKPDIVSALQRCRVTVEARE